MSRLLLVEDDPAIASDLVRQFQNQAFEVDHCYDGQLASRLLKKGHFDCVVLDINIPGKNGLELCREMRQLGIHIPVIMLTAYGDLDDKLEGFGVGADDYLTKPFYFKELLARVNALLKRGTGHSGKNLLTVSDLLIDHDRKIVVRNGKEINLTPREYEILGMLASAAGSIVSKREIISKIWGTSVELDTNTVEVFINSLRNKIDKDFATKLIHTKVGFGYYLSTTV